LGAALRIATTDPAGLPATLKPDEFEKRVESLASSGQGFASFVEQPSDDFQIGVAEALLFSNAERIQNDVLSAGGDRLLGRLRQGKARSEVIETAVANVVSRPPTEEERRLLGDYLARRQDRPAEAVRQVVWALLTDAEFRFNH